MEKKQTAVEWFYQRILATDIKEAFEQAKQMEQEQIEEAWNSAGGGDSYSWGKDYYNANYGETKN
jgi:hypothetical protein